jgi:polyisoprenoid-binding protein YceI
LLRSRLALALVPWAVSGVLGFQILGLQGKGVVPATPVPPASVITIRAQKSGLFSGFAHSHVISAPIARGRVNGQLMTAEIIVVVKDMKVVDPEVSEKDRAEIQSTMLGPKVLDAVRYPEIRFTSSRIEAAGPQRFRVIGTLELHGASRELTLDASGGPDHYHGKHKLKQTDFGIQPVSVAGGTVKVKDELEIEFDVYAADLSK